MEHDHGGDDDVDGAVDVHHVKHEHADDEDDGCDDVNASQTNLIMVMMTMMVGIACCSCLL